MTADEPVAGVPRLCARRADCTRPRGHDDECGPDRADTELADLRAEVERLQLSLDITRAQRQEARQQRDALQRQVAAVVSKGTHMSDLDLDGIEARANAATPGPWKVWGMSVMADPVGNSNLDDGLDVARTTDTRYRKPRTFNANHIAGMDPQTTLALVARIRELEARHE